MAKSVLIRNIDDSTMDWIHQNIPTGVTQEKFIKSLIDSARKISLSQRRTHLAKRLSLILLLSTYLRELVDSTLE